MHMPKDCVWMKPRREVTRLICPRCPMNPTKIVCTLGPASDSEEMIGRLVDEGMDVARLNFSHGDHDTHRRTFERVRKVSADRGEHVAVTRSSLT